MRRFLAFALLALCCAQADAAIAFRQKADGHNTGISSLTVTLGSAGTPVLAGDFIAIWVIFNHSAITWTVSDSVSDTVSNAIAYGCNASNNLCAALYYVQNTAGGSGSSITVTANSGGTTGALEVVPAEYTGVATSTALDSAAAINTAQGASPQTATSGPLTPGQTGDLAITLALQTGGSGTSFSWNNSFAQEQAMAGTLVGSYADQVLASTSALSSSVTITGTGTINWVSLYALFKPGAGSSCTHTGWTSAGTFGAVTASSTSVWKSTGAFGTVDCSTGNYWQSSGVFGVN